MTHICTNAKHFRLQKSMQQSCNLHHTSLISASNLALLILMSILQDYKDADLFVCLSVCLSVGLSVSVYLFVCFMHSRRVQAISSHKRSWLNCWSVIMCTLLLSLAFSIYSHYHVGLDLNIILPQ